MTRVIAHRCLHCGAITGRAESCPVPECCGELMAQTTAPEDMLIAENQVRAWMKKIAEARGRMAYRRPVIVEEPIPGRC